MSGRSVPGLSRRTAVVLVLCGLGVAALAYVYLPATLSLTSGPAEGAWVTVHDAETDERLGRVTAEVADTPDERYTGLSETDSLAADEGMLFVYRRADDHTYVMRNMSFGIDILFVGADHTVTAIHHASAPPPGTDGEQLRYSGRGKWVLEVNRGWTDEHGVEVGDRVAIEYAPSADPNRSVTAGDHSGP